jgi:hypothetical protein
MVATNGTLSLGRDKSRQRNGSEEEAGESTKPVIERQRIVGILRKLGHHPAHICWQREVQFIQNAESGVKTPLCSRGSWAPKSQAWGRPSSSHLLALPSGSPTMEVL